MTDYYAYIKVEAKQWTGHNLDAMKELLKDVVDSNDWDGPEVYSDYIEPYFFPRSGISGGGYNFLKFYAGDDIEVDPGMWVIVHEDGEVELMEDEQFTKMFTKK
jgi:hypothetical protein